MKKFGLDQNTLDELKKLFEKHLALFPSAKVWLFGSRAKGTHKKNSDVDLLISGRTKKLKSAISLLRADIEESNIPFLVDLVYFPELAAGFKKEVTKTKIPFWNPSEIISQSPWRQCPIGFHWVRRHDRQKKHLEDVDGHCRKNPSKHDILKGDEIELISKLEIFKNPKIKVSTNDLGFKDLGNRYDQLISGWTAYWNDILKPKNPIHPDEVKALIASESSFNAKSLAPNAKNIGPAIGLTQLTGQSRRLLSNPKELGNHLVVLTEEEYWDPNKNIAAGIRWLYRKRQILKSNINREPTWKEVFWDYKGIFTSKSTHAKNSKKILDNFFNKLGLQK